MTESSSRLPRPRFVRLLVIAAFAAALAVVLDLGIVYILRKPGPIPASAVLPNVPQLNELRALVQQNPKNRDLQLALAQSYLHYGYYMSAREHFGRALDLGADEWAARSGRAKANIQVERADLARQDLERLIQMRPTQVETYLTLAEQLQHADEWQAAHAVLDRVPLSPDGLPSGTGGPDARVQAAELLATAYSHIDDWERAGRLADACLRLDPKRASSRALKGEVLHATGKYAESIPYLIDGVKAAPKTSQLHYLLATAFMARNGPGDKDRGFGGLQTAVATGPGNGPATLALARELDRRGQKVLAARGYLRAYKLGMEGGRPLLRSGDLLLQVGQVEEGRYRRGLWFEADGHPELAVKEYAYLTSMHNCCRSGYIHMARAYMGMHEPSKALVCLRKAQQREPARAKELDWSIVQALGDTKDEKARIDLLNRMVSDGGKDAEEATYQLAVVADTNGNGADAIRWLDRCLAINPRDPVYHVEMGKQFMQQRADRAKLVDAIRQLETAARLDAENYEAFYYLGLAYSYVNRMDDAVLALRHAVDLRPEEGEGYSTLAKVLSDANRRHEAADVRVVFRRYEDYKQSREILAARCKRDPQNPENQRRMAEFHMSAHEYLAAAERFQKCLDKQPGNRQVRRRLAQALGYLGRREEQRAQLALLGSSAPPSYPE